MKKAVLKTSKFVRFKFKFSFAALIKGVQD